MKHLYTNQSQISRLSSFLHRLVKWSARKIRKNSETTSFEGSGKYWERRYSSGGNSGVGSYAHFAEFKSEIINNFVEANSIESIIEFGCGDGNQLKYSKYKQYTGFDVSETAVNKCRQEFAGDGNKLFRLSSSYGGEKAELSLSLDVIFHLVKDSVFNAYMLTLFAAAQKNVIIYSSNHEDVDRRDGVHVRHRCFTAWVEKNAKNWNLQKVVKNRYPYNGDYLTTSFADFYIYSKVPRNASV